MKEIGVGLIGCGNISTIYLTNIPRAPGLKLRACADMRPEVAEAQGKKFGVEAVPVDALLARDDIDIVVNLTVPAAHSAVSLAALSAGKHVFSEKPLATDVDLGRKVVEEAEARGLHGRLRARHVSRRRRPAGAQADRRGQDRTRRSAGTAFVMSHGMEHWHPDPEFFFKPGGGPVLDVGPYYITALVNLLGPVARVHALTGTGFPERVVTAEGPRKGHRIAVETPTTALSLLEFASGAQIMFGASWDVWRHSHPPIELYGTEGSLRVPDPNFFGGIVEITEQGGDWVRTRFRRHAARRHQLAGGLAAPRQLPGARRRRDGGGAARGPPQSRDRPPGAARAGGDGRDPQGRRFRQAGDDLGRRPSARRCSTRRKRRSSSRSDESWRSALARPRARRVRCPYVAAQSFMQTSVTSALEPL